MAYQTVVTRISEFGTTHYLDFFNVIQGVTLGAAGLTLAEFAREGWSVPGLLMLATALVATIVAHGGATAGAILLSHYPSVLDLVIPMALALAEFVLVLLPATADGPDAIPIAWFVTLFVWQILAGVLTFRVKQAYGSAVYAPDVHDTLEAYLDCLKRDSLGAFSTSAVTCVMVVVLVLVDPPARDVLAYLLMAGTLCSFGFAIHGHYDSRATIRSGLERARIAASST